MKNAVVLLAALVLAIAACGDSSSDGESVPVGGDMESVARSGAASEDTPVPQGSTTEAPASSQIPATSAAAADLPEPADGSGEVEATTSPATDMPEVDPLIEMAMADLGARLGIAVDQISLREAREVTWPDSSLGCPEPGMAYNQVLTPGILIRLSAEGKMYSYHGGGGRDPFLCEQTSIVPEPLPKEDEFVPPPGSETD